MGANVIHRHDVPLARDFGSNLENTP